MKGSGFLASVSPFIPSPLLLGWPRKAPYAHLYLVKLLLQAEWLARPQVRVDSIVPECGARNGTWRCSVGEGGENMVYEWGQELLYPRRGLSSGAPGALMSWTGPQPL